MGLLMGLMGYGALYGDGARGTGYGVGWGDGGGRGEGVESRRV